MILDSRKAKRLWQYLRPFWFLELVAFSVMAVLAALALALPGAIRYLIDDLIPGMVQQAGEGVSLRPIVYFGLFLVGIYLGQVVFSWIRDYLAAYIGAHIIANMRAELFRHLERLSLRFHQSHQVGEIMSRFMSDINRVQFLLTSTLLMFLTNIFMLVAIVIYLLLVNWYLTLIAVIPVPLTIILTGIYGKKLNRISRRLQELTAELSGRLQEAFLSVKTIKAFGQGAREGRRVDSILQKLVRIYVKMSVTTSLSVNLVQFFNMLGPIVVLAWGTYLIVEGSMQLGALIAFYILLTYLYNPIQGLASIHIEVQSAMACVDRVFEYLDIPPEVVEDAHPVNLDDPKGEIRLKGVCFSYGQNGFAFDNLNLNIAAREKVAFVGPSGSGKTTLINLIMRFFDPQAGEISIDGVDIRRLSLSSLRRAIGLVDQEPMLFKTTIFNNIAYADPDATLEDVTRAAKIANIHQFISSLNEGYQNEIGERGVTLSGGEKQRICLARAILKNPPILILDEATSALDSNSEQLIQDSLKRVLVDKTAIIIAHRLATVQHADRIIAIDKGRIVDEGRHEELMVRSSLYRELAAKQLKI
jgi:ABC-type multidrug transport system fused ATPase/permease subunit